jgi:hypothetical protein
MHAIAMTLGFRFHEPEREQGQLVAFFETLQRREKDRRRKRRQRARDHYRTHVYPELSGRTPDGRVIRPIPGR